MDELSRLTFGYHTAGRAYGNILGPEIVGLRDFLLQVGQSSQIKVAAWYSTQGGSVAWQVPAVRIMLEGKLNSIENGLNRIVEREGVPTFVDKPVLPMSLHHLPRFFTPNVHDVLDTPTTSDAYEIAKALYNQQRIKTSVQADNTLVTN